MGAFRSSIQTTSRSEPISVSRRIAIIVIYSRSRIPPPLWDLNLGKLCYLVPVNRPPSPTSLNTHCEDPSMAYSSAIPRHDAYMRMVFFVDHCMDDAFANGELLRSLPLSCQEYAKGCIKRSEVETYNFQD